MDFVALRASVSQLQILSTQDNTLCPELVAHEKNVPVKMEQLASFAMSLTQGSVGRFEAVFDYRGLNPYFLKQIVEINPNDNQQQQNDVISTFRKLFHLLLHYDIVNVSVGSWWRDENLNPFLIFNLNPYVNLSPEPKYQLFSKLNSKIQFLRALYDTELIVCYWCHGVGGNLKVDYKRLKFLQSLDTIARGNRPFYSLRPQPEDISKSVEWFKPDIITHHRYVPTVSNHIKFVLEISTTHFDKPVGNYQDIFSNLLTCLAKYIAGSWHLQNVLDKNKFDQQRALSLIVVQKHNRSVKYSKKNVQRKISTNSSPVSPLGLYETLLWPSRMIGQVLLNCCIPNKNVLEALRHDSATRTLCIGYLSDKVECYPSYLLNTDIPINATIFRAWRSWCKVESPVRTNIERDREYRRLFASGIRKSKTDDTFIRNR